ncbi:Antitoxin VapB32 [Ensifer psoraleae]|nr:Antitoxin VapB32 [Sinorhizobium psoraleae]
MRSTINLDDSLMERARFLTGTKETAALVRQSLETLVRVESGKRLIALGGTMPDAEAAPRRRSAAAKRYLQTLPSGLIISGTPMLNCAGLLRTIVYSAIRP